MESSKIKIFISGTVGFEYDLGKGEILLLKDLKGSIIPKLFKDSKDFSYLSDILKLDQMPFKAFNGNKELITPKKSKSGNFFYDIRKDSINCIEITGVIRGVNELIERRPEMIISDPVKAAETQEETKAEEMCLDEQINLEKAVKNLKHQVNNLSTKLTNEMERNKKAFSDIKYLLTQMLSIVDERLQP